MENRREQLQKKIQEEKIPDISQLESWNSLLIKDNVESLEDCEEVEILANGGGGGMDLRTEGEGEGIME